MKKVQPASPKRRTGQKLPVDKPITPKPADTANPPVPPNARVVADRTSAEPVTTKDGPVADVVDHPNPDAPAFPPISASGVRADPPAETQPAPAEDAPTREQKLGAAYASLSPQELQGVLRRDWDRDQKRARRLLGVERPADVPLSEIPDALQKLNNTDLKD